jgi:hypothetical protein
MWNSFVGVFAQPGSLTTLPVAVSGDTDDVTIACRSPRDCQAKSSIVAIALSFHALVQCKGLVMILERDDR